MCTSHSDPSPLPPPSCAQLGFFHCIIDHLTFPSPAFPAFPLLVLRVDCCASNAHRTFCPEMPLHHRDARGLPDVRDAAAASVDPRRRCNAGFKVG